MRCLPKSVIIEMKVVITVTEVVNFCFQGKVSCYVTLFFNCSRYYWEVSVMLLCKTF